MSKNITVGFTTNLTVWSDKVVNLLKEFKQVNLGMSIETLTSVNDYVRYPAESTKTHQLLERWVQVGQQSGWLIQLRNTPTCLTVHELDTVYEYAWNNNIAVESCNFLYRPECLRIGVLPETQRKHARDRLSRWIDSHPLDVQEKVINTRDPNQAKVQVYQDALSYLNYLDVVVDESYRMPELVAYLKQLEGNRKNSILNYIPEYEELFRSAGY
jgi:hypothetical protein